MSTQEVLLADCTHSCFHFITCIWQPTNTIFNEQTLLPTAVLSNLSSHPIGWTSHHPTHHIPLVCQLRFRLMLYWNESYPDHDDDNWHQIRYDFLHTNNHIQKSFSIRKLIDRSRPHPSSMYVQSDSSSRSPQSAFQLPTHQSIIEFLPNTLRTHETMHDIVANP